MRSKCAHGGRPVRSSRRVGGSGRQAESMFSAPCERPDDCAAQVAHCSSLPSSPRSVVVRWPPAASKWSAQEPRAGQPLRQAVARARCGRRTALDRPQLARRAWLFLWRHWSVMCCNHGVLRTVPDASQDSKSGGRMRRMTCCGS